MKTLVLFLLLCVSTDAQTVSPADIRATIQHMRTLAIEQKTQLDDATSQLTAAQTESALAKSQLTNLQSSIDSLRSWGQQQEIAANTARAERDRIAKAYHALKNWLGISAAAVVWLSIMFFGVKIVPLNLLPYLWICAVAAAVLAYGSVWFLL